MGFHPDQCKKGSYRMSIVYEWDIEFLDNNGDIHDHYFSESLQDSDPEWERLLNNYPQSDGFTLRLVLVRYAINDETKELDYRQWAYPSIEQGQWSLPNKFGHDGYKVPMRFHHEIATLSAGIENFIPFQYNDGGREKAGYKGYTGDCGTRAIAIATGEPYRSVYKTVLKMAKKERVRKMKRSHPRTGIRPQLMKDYLENRGFTWVPTMTVGSGCKIHLTPKELPSGILVVRVSRHYTTMIDGVLHDTYNCSRQGTRCVYGYWIKS